MWWCRYVRAGGCLSLSKFAHARVGWLACAFVFKLVGVPLAIKLGHGLFTRPHAPAPLPHTPPTNPKVREGRSLRSSTVPNSNDPEYDETFVLLVSCNASV
jgi:hypothetical protein